jgi:hypothetical protein
MTIRPYHAWVFLLVLPVVSAQRACEWARRELVNVFDGRTRWASLTRNTTEELDKGTAHRYVGLARDLAGEPDVGYFQERNHSTLWSVISPEDQRRIERYYMAQGILAPSVLRLDERWRRVVVDCDTASQAGEVAVRMGLTVIRDYGQGLLLARPEE